MHPSGGTGALPLREQGRPKKSLGQCFLIDDEIARRIVSEAAIGPEEVVLEIGPGRGALTGYLLSQGSRVIGVEIDRVLCQRLKDQFGHQERFVLIEADILKVDWCEWILPPQGHLIVVANLPYQITSPVLFKLLAHSDAIERAILMVQAEVGHRIASQPGCKEYGILSVRTQLKSRPEVLFPVDRSCFRPSPRVDSCVIRLPFGPTPGSFPAEEEAFNRIVKTAFGQRRKMLRNALSAMGEPIYEAARCADIDLTRRAETVSIGEFVRLSDAYSLVSGGE
ncbi:MAG: 16S rRNA (adenine(1518)-N(6)/adenine(1519)-N(6))-dimethyltransferase RsmA [Candidatus Latescibacterota bacterium]